MTATAPHILSTLDECQLAAATSRSARVAVLAGPGSGKTRTLVARVCWLLTERQMPSHEILVFAFTRAAAAEIRRRVVAEVGDELAQLLTVTTFHAWGLRALRQAGLCDLAPATEEEAEAELKALYNGATSRPEAKRIGIKAFRQYLTRRAAVGEAHDIQASDEAVALGSIYLGRLRLQGLIPFGAVLTEVLEHWEDLAPSTRVRHVLVDEAHDLTALELYLVRHVAAEHTLVFDPRQAIYAWRGADPDALRAYIAGDTFEVHGLRCSYRFGRAIAEVATTHSHALGQDEVVACGETAIQGTVRLDCPRHKMVREIHELSATFDPQNVAVLCRTNRECERVAAELGDVAALVRREGTEHRRGTIALARLFLNRNDNAAFRSVWRHLGLEERELQALEHDAGHARSLLSQLGRGRSDVHEIELMLGRLRGNPTISQVAFEMVDRDGFGDADLAGLDMSIEDGLEHLTSEADADAFAHVGNRIAVATVHAAKGREWSAVVVCGFPIKNQEDERIRFVAVTRARLALVTIEEEAR